MKIIFNKEEDMNRYIERFLDNSERLCIQHLSPTGPIPLEECEKYDAVGCLKCLEDHGIEFTYVKNCTECAKTSTCTQYYRNDLISQLGTCNPVPR